MKKELNNKIENIEEIEMNEEAKTEVLSEETLDETNGGIALATCYAVLTCSMVMMAGKPLWLLATM